MKVSDLIEELKQFNDDTEVMFSYNYGDHCNTSVAQKINSVYENEVVYSDYHNMHKMANEEYDYNKEKISVIILE